MTAPELLRRTCSRMSRFDISLYDALTIEHCAEVKLKMQTEWDALWEAAAALYAYADPFDTDLPRAWMLGRLQRWCETASRAAQIDAIQYAQELLQNTPVEAPDEAPAEPLNEPLKFDPEEVEQWLDRR